MSNVNTAMGLAFIQAQQRVNQQEKPVETATTEPTKSNAHRVFDHLRDEGIPLDVHTIAKALNLENQKVSTALFQLKKVGYVETHNPVAGGYMTYEAVAGREYGDARPGRPSGTPNKARVSQVVTPKPEPRMIAMPAPAGGKIVINTSSSSHAFGFKEAREVYKQLSALFDATEISYDD